MREKYPAFASKASAAPRSTGYAAGAAFPKALPVPNSGSRGAASAQAAMQKRRQGTVPCLVRPSAKCPPAHFRTGWASDIFRNTKPRAKKAAREATAMLIVPPASFTQAMTAEPRKEAPLEKTS